MIDQALRVRRAARSDAPAIALVLQAAFAEYASLYTRAAFAATTPPTEEIARRLGEGPTWIALLHRTVVGTVSAVPRGEALYVRSMAVVPEVRGRGVGRLLLEQVERYADERGFRCLDLSTTPFLTSAIALYERAGFSQSDGELRELCGTPLVNMRKALVLQPQTWRPAPTQAMDVNSMPATKVGFSLVTEHPAAAPAVANRHFADKLAVETDASDVHSDLERGVDGFVVVDARSPEDYARCHIPGAISLPHRSITGDTKAALPKGKLIVTYCWGPGCNAANKAAVRLSALGFQVKEMIGGIEYWRKEGYRIEGSSPHDASLHG